MTARSGCAGMLVFRCVECGAHRRAGVSCAVPCQRCPWRGGAKVASTLELVPRVPVRHWTFRPSPRQRAALADPKILRRVNRVFVGELFATMKSLLPSPAAIPSGCGAVSVVHRANAALELDPHLHALVLDGVYRFTPDGEAVFVPLHDDPDPNTLGALTGRIQAGLAKVMGSRSKPSGSVQQRGVKGPVVRRVRDPQDGAKPRRSRPGRGAIRDGMRVFAGSTITADDRPTLARVARYLTRPIPDPAGFSDVDDKTVRYRLEHPFADGTTHVEFDRDALSQRLQQVLPRGPRADVTLHGLLAPRAAGRPKIIPGQLHLFESSRRRRPPVAPAPPEPKSRAPDEPRASTAAIDERCPECGGAMKIASLESLDPAPSLR